MIRRLVLFLSIGALNAGAQDVTGSIRMTVVDSLTSAPLAGASAFLDRVGPNLHRGETSGADGSVSFDELPAGAYTVGANRQGYPQPPGEHFKIVRLNEAQTGEVTVRLAPGAEISGRVLDEDGDSIENCSVEIGGRFGNRSTMADRDGYYRLSNVLPGRILLYAHCASPVFEPRPLSSGRDPAPTHAWPVVLYPAALDESNAVPIDLAPGTRRTGLDFHIAPLHVTQVHVKLTGLGPSDTGPWNCNLLLAIQTPVTRYAMRSIMISRDSFDIPDVLPGSYVLRVAGVNDRGAFARLTVTDEPVTVTAELHDPRVVHGRIEMEDQSQPPQNADLFVQPLSNLTGGGRFPPEPDGSFEIATLVPVRIRLADAQGTYIKTISIGGRELPNGVLDPDTATGDLRVVLSARIATIQGIAPPGMHVWLLNQDRQVSTAPIDENGRFRIGGLAPGDYRIGVSDMPSGVDAGLPLTLHEGETLNVELKQTADATNPYSTNPYSTNPYSTNP